MADVSTLPLQGLKVIEMSHMVMGPVVGAILAELGAQVIKIEPPGGDPTRRLGGSGAGYFPMYNRQKKSVCIDITDPQGMALAKRLIETSDIFVENFRPQKLEQLGLGYEALSAANPRLIYCAEKGYLAGPYEQRPALDEVVQMMSGLAYMTGPPGRPLRAGASVVDVSGGMFGVIAILSALEQRHRTGRGCRVSSSLYETAVYMVGQHMAQMAVTGEAALPMPARNSAWAIYDVFETRDQQQVFVGVVSDTLWDKFCAAFGLADLRSDHRYRTNAQRVKSRDVLLPQVRELFARFDKTELVERLQNAQVPFAPVGKPEDLFDDPHLAAGGGLVPVSLPGLPDTRLPILPLEIAGRRPGKGGTLSRPGEHTRSVLAGLGLTEDRIDQLVAQNVLACAE